MPTSPLSPKLTELRSSLESVNNSLFKIILQRRELVTAIQGLKSSPGDIWVAYDSVREKELFKRFKVELRALEVKELFAFSLLMESHAWAPKNYPEWSEGVHVTTFPLEAHHRINPLILEVTHPDLFECLSLRPSFNFLRES